MCPPASNSTPFLIAIVGGSGAGKTCLAKKLLAALGPGVARLSLDDFYRDRSHLSPARRAALNFDHPRAIDWPALERALDDLRAGHAARLPRYDFKTHSRIAGETSLPPKPVIVVDGLWLLRRASVRRLFALKIFIDCPMRTRRHRRLARDLRSRGRSRAAVLAQLRATVEPMHEQFVVPQKKWADIILPHDFDGREVRKIVGQLQRQMQNGK